MPRVEEKSDAALIIIALAVAAVAAVIAYFGFTRDELPVIRAQDVPGPTFVVNAADLECYVAPDDYSPITRQLPAGSVQEIGRYILLPGRVWYSETTSRCWTLVMADSDSAPRTFFSREDAEAYAREVQRQASPAAP